MKILAVIPAFNEAGRIGPVIARVRLHLPALVIDDGSSDDTARVAAEAGAEVLCQNPNQGKGAALRAGFGRALELGYEAVLTLDADGQHDPAEIPLFLRAYAERRADLIVGARDYAKMPPVRRLSNTLGRWILSAALGQLVRDNQSGYRLISGRLMTHLLESREQGFEFEVEMLVACIRRGLRLEWVPIRTIYAGEASHIRSGRHVAGFLRMAWKARRGLRE